jgi:hypothetical protein
MSNAVERAMETLRRAMAEDPDYAWSWHCNLAMASVDEGMDHAAANKAAERFMRLAFQTSRSEYGPEGDEE